MAAPMITPIPEPGAGSASPWSGCERFARSLLGRRQQGDPPTRDALDGAPPRRQTGPPRRPPKRLRGLFAVTSLEAEVEARLGVTFHRPALLRQAFVHRSYLNEYPQEGLESNERPRVFGDAGLRYLVAQR